MLLTLTIGANVSLETAAELLVNLLPLPERYLPLFLLPIARLPTATFPHYVHVNGNAAA